MVLKALEGAKESIYLVSFGLSDRPVLSMLRRKLESPVGLKVYYDKTGSPYLRKLFPGADIYPIKKPGLMHQKIAVLDHEVVFIGSANFTTASLRMHDNLVLGFCDKQVARFLEEHPPFTPGFLSTKVAGQKMELWLLPDTRGEALEELKKRIREAKETVRIALFTFTHPSLVDEVIAAHARGVKVKVVIDMHCGQGSSKSVVQRLLENKIPVYLSQGVQLLHHKFVYIDEKLLISGSANWTKAAFYKNADCILALHDLNGPQKRFMKELWRNIETGAQKL